MLVTAVTVVPLFPRPLLLRVQGLNRLPMEYVFCRMDWLFQKEEQEAQEAQGRPRRLSTPQELEDGGEGWVRRMDRYGGVDLHNDPQRCGQAMHL